MTTVQKSLGYLGFLHPFKVKLIAVYDFRAIVHNFIFPLTPDRDGGQVFLQSELGAATASDTLQREG